jgi:hypothetical protein
VVELTLPADVRVSRLPDNQNAVAFTYGPVVLSAGMGTEQMVTEPQWASLKATIPNGVNIKETIAIQEGNIEDWLANIGQNLIQNPGTLEFSLQGTDEDDNLTFAPQYLRYGERYGIYFELQGQQGEAPAPVEDAGDVSTDCEGASEGTGGQANGTGGMDAGSGGDSGLGTGGASLGAGGSGLGTGGVSASAGGGVGVGGTATAAGGGSGEPTLNGDVPGAGCGCSVPGRRAPPFSLVLSSLFGAFVVRRARRRSSPQA